MGFCATPPDSPQSELVDIFFARRVSKPKLDFATIMRPSPSTGARLHRRTDGGGWATGRFTGSVIVLAIDHQMQDLFTSLRVDKVAFNSPISPPAYRIRSTDLWQDFP